MGACGGHDHAGAGRKAEAFDEALPRGNGRGSPPAPIRRATFLERCLADLAALEPKIGAFVHLNIDGARVAADEATARWREGRPRSPIDGMPIGIKDIIETADMPTEKGSPLFAGWRSGARRRQRRGAARGRRGHPRQDGDHRIRRHRAARHAQSARSARARPAARAAARPPAVAAGMVSAALGTQVIGSTIRPASYCGCVGFKASLGALNRGGSYDGLSQSVDRRAGGDAWRTPGRSPTRSRCAPAAIPAIPACSGPTARRPRAKPRRLAFLETAGWAAASTGAKAAMAGRAGAAARPPASTCVTRAIQRQARRGRGTRSRRRARCRCAINGWESRWPLNTYRARDASKLSRVMLDRLAEAEAMTPRRLPRRARATREGTRAYAELAAECDACVTLSAPGCRAGRPAIDRRSDLHRARLAARHSGDLAAGARG